ncbi:MAG: hypothetical protein JXR71_06090 [Bacteroidales bacterium]|nr:hypothetical protein [Bacteroidales bacterium]
MARSDASILGDFTGRIGNIIVYKLNGKTVMRIRPNTTKRKPTPRQKQSRDDFTLVMRYMGSLKRVINTGFYDVTEGRFAYHSALSTNLKAYKAAGRPEGAEWLKLSEGNRAGAEDLQLEVLENNKFRISWGKPTAGAYENHDDRVFVVALNNSGDRWYRYTEQQNNLRSQGETLMELNFATAPGDEIYFFLFFQDVDGSLRRKDPKNVSASQFVGKAVIQG